MTPESGPLQQCTVRLQVTIRTCRRDDLPALEWFGLFTAHRDLIRSAYEGQERGETLMLVAEAQGYPVGQVWIDLTRKGVDATGVLWAVRVFPFLQSLGIGAQLMTAAEAVLRRRGFTRAELGVERDNERAQRFYERLGYSVVGSQQGEYRYTTPEGVPVRVSTDLWILRKPLA
jgi:ribosomal protein S18 acetylase RimI-like enzyme